MPELLRIHKALADETRLRLVRLLSRGALNVNELIAILQMGQSRVSRHLRILAEVGLVTHRREGTWIYYEGAHDPALDPTPEGTPELGDPLVAEILATIARHERTVSHYEEDLQSLEAALERRKEQTRSYFDSTDDPHEFLRHKSLDVGYYREVATGLLPERCECILDLGTGSGLLLPALLERADQAIAVDSSTAMLDLARQTVGAEVERCDLRLGDLEHLPVADGEVDAVMACMVLHHVSHPERALVEAHRVLKPGGHLVIVDLHQHHDESLRERVADLWLGFRPVDVERWVTAAQFEITGTDTLAPERQPDGGVAPRRGGTTAARTPLRKKTRGAKASEPHSLTLITLQGQKPWQRQGRPRRRAAAKTTR